jgi:hypothetical protein
VSERKAQWPIEKLRVADSMMAWSGIGLLMNKANNAQIAEGLQRALASLSAGISSDCR